MAGTFTAPKTFRVRIYKTAQDLADNLAYSVMTAANEESARILAARFEKMNLITTIQNVESGEMIEVQAA